LIKDTPLLTLLGPGETGKTRMMLQAAEEMIEDYPDGVWLVELAPLTDPDLIPKRVAAALNVQEQPGRSMLDTIVEYLRRKETLLLLDNVEHLVRESAEFTEDLLENCPRLKILATGQSALAHLYRREGKLDEALAVYRRTILSWQEQGHQAAVAHQLECFAYIAIARERYADAAQLLGAAQMARERIHSPSTEPEEINEKERAIRALEESIGAHELERLIKRVVIVKVTRIANMT